ncbi:MAG: CPBP family intramembrane glutamic endopeptidase, partial [Pseudohongiellaceae bacterium]
IAVALFEETVFRGALLRGLARQSGPLTALLATSIIYAAVHFIYFETPVAGGTDWLTAPRQFLPAYSQFITPEKIDAFLSLCMLGILLGLIRLKTGNIIQSIGLHAGLVAGIKLFRFFTLYNPDNRYSYLVSSHDYRLGIMALLLLTAVTVIYYLYYYRNNGPALLQTRG